MAIYHLSAKIISRGKHQSAIASAAYRSGQLLTDEINGKSFNYSRKADVAFSQIFLPNNAPKKFLDRQTLWNDIENFEKNCNAQLAREIEFALPIELPFQEQKKLACDFAKTFAQNGMCVDLAFHNKKGNPHCHLMLSMRSLDINGHWLPKNSVQYKLDCNGNKIPVLDKQGNQKKEKNGKRVFEKIVTPTNDWNNKDKILEWRKLYQNLANSALLNSNLTTQIDCRSYSDQGIKKIPFIHLGQAATAMERRSILTERGNFNRKIARINLLNQKLQDYIDVTKKIPSPDDIPATFLWISQTIKNIEKEKTRIENQLLNEIQLLKDSILLDSKEFKEFKDAENLVHHNDEQYWYYLDESNKLNAEIDKLKDNEPSKSLFDFLESEQHKTWRLTLEQKNLRLADAKQNEQYFALARDSSRKALTIAENNLSKKRNSISVNSSTIDNIQETLNAIIQDLQYLQKVRKNLITAITSISQNNSTIKQIEPKLESIFNTNQSRNKLKHFDTSPDIVRTLRITEQSITNKNFLAELNRNLGNDSITQLVAYSDPNTFKIPTDWDLLSELDKDELRQKKIWRSI